MEIPLVVMDGTFPHYMRIPIDKAWVVIKQLIDRVEVCHGVMTILWHNTFMEGEGLRVYEKLLQYSQERGAWMTNSGYLLSD